MTPKVTVTICCQFDLVYDPKRSSVIRGRHDLLYYLKGHGDDCSRFDQKVTGPLEFALTYFMTPKVTVTFVVSLT